MSEEKKDWGDDLYGLIEHLKDIASAEEFAKWESLKQRMQGAFQVLYGDAIPLDIDRVRTMLYHEWDAKHDFADSKIGWLIDELPDAERTPERRKQIADSVYESLGLKTIDQESKGEIEPER